MREHNMRETNSHKLFTPPKPRKGRMRSQSPELGADAASMAQSVLSAQATAEMAETRSALNDTINVMKSTVKPTSATSAEVDKIHRSDVKLHKLVMGSGQ